MKIVIIGGVAGGASAAARARRHDEHAEIVLLQSGPDISYASCGMPYFIGGEIKDRKQMAVQTPATLDAKLKIDVRVNVRVSSIDPAKKIITGRHEKTSQEFTESYDELILAVGASPLKPPIPGIDLPSLFSLRNLEDMDQINSWIVKSQQALQQDQRMHVVVAGAGFIGLEMVEQLKHRNIDVSLVEMMPQILGPLDVEMANILEQDLLKRGVNVITGDGIKEFQQVGDNVVVHLGSGKQLPPAQMTILGLGVRPDTAIAREAGIETTKRGHIVVDEHLKTNIPNVWAVGDAVEVKNPILGGDAKWAVPLAGPANRQGRMAADNIYGKNRKFKGTYAAAVVRSFDLIAAAVGMNEKMLKAMHLPYDSVHVHPGSHAGYYPGAKSINFKLLFSPEDGKIYGAQAVGEDGVEKRIDVISTAMQGNLTVEDLAELELCYAPPVGSAKDPVNIAGMAAQNIMDGFVQQIQWDHLEEVQQDPDTLILDVRNPGEIQNGGALIEGAMAIPLPELRNRIDEIPQDKKLVVSCASGQRAYYACRILLQSGFEGRVYNLSGAFKTYQNTPVYLSHEWQDTHHYH